MELKNRRFTVVEQAGYEGERDIRSFPTWREANDWMQKRYDDEELDSMHPNSLHVDIRQDWTDEHGQEHGEYVC